MIAATPVLAVTEGAEGLAVREFARRVDADWRRTSYSALVRAAEDRGAGVRSEPEVSSKDDEVEDLPLEASEPPAAESLLSPMADLPGGPTFGSLVHAVLETADPWADDLEAELAGQADRHFAWWPVDASTDAIASALVPVHDTPLGPLAIGKTLRDIGLRDRLRELDFEMPLTGGDLDRSARDVTLAEVADLLAEHLPPDDPLHAYSGRLRAPALGAATLRGYLSGSIDVVLRIPDPAAGHRYLVVDYKTNRLGDAQRPAVTAADYGSPQLTSRRCCTPTTPCRHCCIPLCCTDFCDGGYRTTNLTSIWVVCCICSCVGCADPKTPAVEGHPAGVFSWLPPSDLVTALSDLLDGGRSSSGA